MKEGILSETTWEKELDMDSHVLFKCIRKNKFDIFFNTIK